MSQRPRDREIPEEHRAQEHLANERTFLAWVRTTIALISLGFVLTRLGPWLSEAGTSRALSRASPIGIGLIVLGALLTILAAWRYDTVNRQIESGCVKTDRSLVWFVASSIAIVSAALIVYMGVISGSK